MDSQHPTGWEKIQNLESRSRYEKLEVADLPNIAPHFTSELRVSSYKFSVIFILSHIQS